MVHFRPGSQVWQLITLLSIAGEYPVWSLFLLGNARVYNALIHKLDRCQTIRSSQTGAEMTSRLLTISGSGKAVSIWLYKGALPILDWLGPNVRQYYLDTFWIHRFPGDAAHRERNHRVAESAALCMRAGIEVRPTLLPKLQNRARLHLVPTAPCFYLARDMKKVGEVEMNKTIFTRMTGAVFAGGSCYAVYNTREAVMKWSGMGEFKALHNLIELSRLNAGISEIDSAILIGRTAEVALRTLVESEQGRRLSFRFDSIYRHIHFVPMSEAGIRQLRLLLQPGWRSQLLSLLFEPETRSYDRGHFEYDACVEGVYVLSHLDGDLARLIRFREGIERQTGKFEVLCFPHQAQLVREYLGSLAAVKTIELEQVEAALGTEGRESIEG